MQFSPAVKQQRKLRMAISGPSGSGKTWTSLLIASGVSLDKNIGLIDTEHASASLYADMMPFQVLNLDDHRPQVLIEAVEQANKMTFDVLIIDSLSHAWAGLGGVLDQVNTAADQSRSKDSFSEWRKIGTPLQNRLLRAITMSPLHIIATLRVKSEWLITTNQDGKMKPTRLGLTPVQREGTEYEFDIFGSLDLEHNLTIEKTRIPVIADQVIPEPGAELGSVIYEWLSSGDPQPTSQEMISYILGRWGQDGLAAEAQRKWLKDNYDADDLPNAPKYVLAEMYARWKEMEQ